MCLWGLKKWDLRASQQPNYYIANSRLVAERIRKIYGREAFVIPPPIEVNRFHMSNDIQDYYLILSRLMPYKRIDLAIEACKRNEPPSGNHRRWSGSRATGKNRRMTGLSFSGASRTRS
jgi:glycosyltransferase involved in cell wall biosynthesis